MRHYSNREIARSENLWNEYFNTSAFDENRFDLLSFAERLEILDSSMRFEFENE